MLAILWRGAEPIDYETRAKSLGAVLRDLSTKTGMKLTADPDLALEPIIVHVERTPVDRLLKEIAVSVSATVEGNSITRSLAMRKKLEESEVAKQRRIIEYQTEQYVKVLKLPWDVPSLTALIRKKLPSIRSGPSTEEQIGPVPRALARCLLDVNLDAVARLSFGHRLVFATSPNSLQRPLGKNAQKAIRLLVPEQAAWGKALKAVEKNPSTLMEDSEAKVFGGYAQDLPPLSHDPWARTVPFFSPPSKAILVVSKVDWGIYRVKFLMLSKEGRAIFGFEAAETLFRDPKDFEQSKATPEPAYTYTVPLVFAPSVAWEKVWKDVPVKEKLNLAPAREAVAKFFIDSPEAEPLALLPSDGILALAHSRGLNIVACLPDSFADCFQLVKDNKVSLGIMESYLRDGSVAVDRPQKSWLVVRPSDPILSHQKRANRQAFQRLMRSAAYAKRVTIEDYGRYYPSAGLMPAYTEFDRIELVTAFKLYPPEIGGKPSLFAFYTTLTEAQRNSLAKGGEILYKDLSSEQRATACEAAFGAYDLSGVRLRQERSAYGLPTIYEPTESMPNGLMANARIHAPRKRDRIVSFIDISDPKRRVFWSENIDQPPMPFIIGGFWLGPPSGGKRATEYALSIQIRLPIEIEIRPGEFLREDVEEILPQEFPKTVSLEALPSDAQKRILKAWDTFKER